MRRDLAARVGNPALASAAIAFVVVLAVAGGLGQWLIASLETRAEEAARRDARTLAESVARTLASQFGRAARLEIPLDALPGADNYLRESLEQTPGVASITLLGADGRSLSTARAEGAAGRERDQVEAVVQGPDAAAGKILVTTLPAGLAKGFAGAHLWTAGFALVAALLAGLLAYLIPGRNLARRQRVLVAAMSGDLHVDALDPAREGDALDEALDAWAAGERQMLTERAAFDALAEELRAVDFDDAMRPEIERLTQELAEAEAGGAR